ncbi:MAG: helix-turn-helix domain-containing protein [Nitrososphaerales archaeon]
MTAGGSHEADLKGNTLRVYTYLFKVQRSGIREAQRSLGFKSASLAQYHLDKLVDMELATKDESGEYFLAKEIKIEALEQFLKIGTHIIPRFVLYSVMLTILFAYFIAVEWSSGISRISVWAYIFAIAGLIITWYETIRAWRRTPLGA